MTIKEISIFKEFRCQGDKCPDTCCRGWIIPLTPEDRERYLKEPGLLRFRILFAMLGKRLGDFNSSCKNCPFLNSDMLCKLQLAKGHDFIPETCRTYPRSYRNYGEFEERFIDLSCIHAARLFISHHKELDFNVYEGEAESDPYSTNDDTDYLFDLTASRKLFTEALRGADSYEKLSVILTEIDSYAQKAQDAFIHGKTDYLKTDPFSPVRDTADQRKVFPLSSIQIRSLFDTGLFHEYLKVGSPYIYDILKLYVDRPQKWHAEKNVAELCGRYAGAFPDRAEYYASYYIYYLYKFYMNCYEDYSFVRNVRIGLIHLGLIYFLHALYYDRKGELPMEEFTHIISAYNRRAYFNYENLDKMYEAVSF